MELTRTQRYLAVNLAGCEQVDIQTRTVRQKKDVKFEMSKKGCWQHIRASEGYTWASERS